MESKFIGTKVIVRGERSGLFFGTLDSKDGREVRLTNVRRLWYWDGAASDFQLAAEGVSIPENCKFTMFIDEIEILDANEIIPCTKIAIESLTNVAEWKA